ncbi:MAG: polysaccharide pyruvyl transferase family protein [bacterium]
MQIKKMNIKKTIKYKIMKKEQTIAIFSRKNITNYGDPIIGDCLQYIINQFVDKKNFKVKIYDIYKHKNDTEKRNKYYKKVVKDSSAVVFPGGGINSLKFNQLIKELIDTCEEENVNFYFNAIGLLKINPNEENVELLKELFNTDCVKQITTRGDFTCLQSYAPDKRISNISDPGIFASETYNVKKDKKSEVIGLGLIRPEIFEANKNSQSVETIFKMYKDLINVMIEKKVEFKLFCNGMKKDYEFGLEVLNELNLDVDKYMADLPKSSIELVECISQFKGIIAARMHANIIATSLDVPTVGLVWNDKMNLFAAMIDRKEFYLSEKDLMDANKIYNKLQSSIKKSYDKKKIDSLKKEASNSVEIIIENLY